MKYLEIEETKNGFIVYLTRNPSHKDGDKYCFESMESMQDWISRYYS